MFRDVIRSRLDALVESAGYLDALVEQGGHLPTSLLAPLSVFLARMVSELDRHALELELAARQRASHAAQTDR